MGTPLSSFVNSRRTLNGSTATTMKFLIAFALLAVAAAAPAELSPARILAMSHDQNEDLSYTYSFAGEEGIKREESGSLIPVQKLSAEDPDFELVVRGSYSYVVDGVTYTVNYVADRNGFQPEGAHLPVAPIAFLTL